MTDRESNHFNQRKTCRWFAVVDSSSSLLEKQQQHFLLSVPLCAFVLAPLVSLFTLDAGGTSLKIKKGAGVAEGDEEIATNPGAAVVTEVTEQRESVGGGGRRKVVEGGRGGEIISQQAT